MNITAGIIVFYANQFVMKNRSKELGLYGMLGLNKSHLFVMTFIELLIFGLVAVSLGLTIGVLFDQLIYAFCSSSWVPRCSSFDISTFCWY